MLREPVALLVAPTATYGALAVLAVAASLGIFDLPVWLTAAYVGLGFTLWTLMEYALHRGVQHAALRRRWLHIDDHAYHHRFPDDLRELVYAMHYSLCGALAGAGLAWLFTWELGAALATFAGLAGGYLAYEWVHMATHAGALRARRPWLARWVRNHYRHHYSHANRHFGFVTSLWDRVFGTD